MTTYREILEAALDNNGETWADIIRLNVGEYEDYDGKWIDLDTPVNTGYGLVEGPAITAWTRSYVYFGAQYDGAEWITSVPRNPCDAVIGHIGGG